MKQKVSIFGSTGSIGTQTLDVIRNQSEDFEINFLVAGKNKESLEKQIKEFKCKGFLTNNSSDALYSIPDTLYQNSDIIVIAIQGEASIYPTIEGLKAGKKVLLASKEALVAEGEKIMEIKTGQLLPIDSELAALYQCLQGKNIEDIEKVILTASGGPFFGKTRKQLETVTLKDALNHPTWKMGKEITINSATLMNKGFEVIESHFLFGIPYEKIDVVIHPQSLVHAIVIFKDGNVLMHAASTDMRIPISWALNFPEIKENIFQKFNPVGKKLEFFEPDHETFPALNMAYEALRNGKEARQSLLIKNSNKLRVFLENNNQFIDLLW